MIILYCVFVYKTNNNNEALIFGKEDDIEDERLKEKIKTGETFEFENEIDMHEFVNEIEELKHYEIWN